jgi:hypothetical protein
MGEGMGGPHEIRYIVASNDPAAPEVAVTIKANFG